MALNFRQTACDIFISVTEQLVSSFNCGCLIFTTPTTSTVRKQEETLNAVYEHSCPYTVNYIYYDINNTHRKARPILLVIIYLFIAAAVVVDL